MRVAVESLLAELRCGLETLYRERLRGVYLYGSYARGEAGSESDLDVLIVLDRVSSCGAEIDRTSELVSRVSLTSRISVSRVFVAENEWQKGESPFLANVREESIPVRAILRGRDRDREGAMNPLYLQMLGVIGVIVVLGAVGIMFAVKERRERERGGQPSHNHLQ